MKIFKNNNTLYYSLLPEVQLNDKKEEKFFLEESNRQSSCWFKNLPIFINKASTLIDYFNILHNKEAATIPGETAKVCPAIQSVLDNSILIKTPADIAITIDSTGSYSWEVSSNRMIYLEEHILEQVGSGKDTIFKNNVILKLCYRAVISSGGRYPYIFLQPHYHNKLPISIVNGIVPPSYSKNWVDLNIIMLLEVPKEGVETHIIKSGAVIAYLWAPQKLKLRNTEYSSIPPSIRRRFLGGVKT
jgi:hypothetical protein